MNHVFFAEASVLSKRKYIKITKQSHCNDNPYFVKICSLQLILKCIDLNNLKYKNKNTQKIKIYLLNNYYHKN